MCVTIHTYIYAYIHTHTYIYIHPYTHMHAYIHKHAYTCKEMEKIFIFFYKQNRFKNNFR